MKLTIDIDFWFDGIDECSEEEIKDYLKVLLIDGSESTCSEVELLNITI